MSEEQTVQTPEPVDASFLPRAGRTEKNLADKIPGLTLSWADLNAMDFNTEAEERQFVESARVAKRDYRGAHFIYLSGRPFIHRTISRRELAILRNQVAQISKAKTDDVPEGMNPEAFAAQLMKDSLEEEMVMACAIFPKYTRLTVKEEDAGIITSLHDSIVQASGFNQNSAPIRL